MPSREEIMNSPARDAPPDGATSNFTAPAERAQSPVMDDPSAELEQELAGQHLGRK